MQRHFGLWVNNGEGIELPLMHSLKLTAMTVIYDYLASNQVIEYKRKNPDTQIIVRFMHPGNWLQDIKVSAENTAREIVGKWDNDPVLRELDPLIIAMNEPNLPNECDFAKGRDIAAYETKEHYQDIAEWFGVFAEYVKQHRPEIKLLTPPLAYGHKEDGDADLITGEPKIGWAGYDYLAPLANRYCDRRIAAHYYWGDAGGSIKSRLYEDQDGLWHALRWRRVLALFEHRYGWIPDIWIDEFNNMSPSDSDYYEQLEYFLNKTLSNKYVKGATCFLWGAPHGNEINSLVDNVGDLPALVNKLNMLTVEVDEGDTSMWYKDFTEQAQAHYEATGEALNDAESYGVTVHAADTGDSDFHFACIGVHHLTGEENHRNHHIYFDARGKNDERMNGYYVSTHIEGSELVLNAVIDKPDIEPGGNIPMDRIQNVYSELQVLSVDNEYPSDTIDGLSTKHPDEGDGNTLGHHSFFVVWQLVKVTEPEPPTPPTPPPDTEIKVSTGCDNMVVLSNAGILFATGKLSEAGYIEIVTKLACEK